MPRLFTAASSNGAGTAVNWPGGKGTLVVQGTLSGSTTKLEMSVDGGTIWHDVKDADDESVVQLAAAGMKPFELSTACQLRGNISGGPTSVDAWANPE